MGKNDSGRKRTPAGSSAQAARPNGNVQERRAHELEWRSCPALRQVRRSNKHWPGYTKAVSTVGMLGDGRTHGSPVASKSIDRRQPFMVTTVRSQSTGSRK